MGRTSAGGSVSSICESLCCQKVKTSTWVNLLEKKFGPHVETKLREELQAGYNSERPFSSRQVVAKLEQSIEQITTEATTDVKPKKELKFGSNVFVPSNAPPGVAQTSEPKQLFGSTMQSTSAQTVSPSGSVPMKLPNMVLDKYSGDPLEWPEWSSQFIATIEQSRIANSIKVKYL